MTEADFLAALRALPLHSGALGLRDDAARLGTLVLTTDTMVEGVHYRATDDPQDVAWRLVATNLSDLAAKGATPVGILLNYPLRAGDDVWDAAFLHGLAVVLKHYAAPLLGGDTVSLPTGASRVLTLTAIGDAPVAPERSGAKAGDHLYVTGTIGAALLGFEHPDIEPNAYTRPTPRLADGIALAQQVTAMMDVSDGLLLGRTAHG